MAAIAAAEAGAQVTLVDKAGIDRSGCAGAGNDHFLAILDQGEPWDTTEVFLAWHHRLTEGLVDPAVAEQAFAGRVQEMVRFLEELGIPMRDPQTGRYIRTKAFAQPGEYFINFDGRDIKPALTRAAQRRGVNLVRRVAITELLAEDGRVAGAVGFQIRSGEFVVFRSRATVLATGNVSRLYENPGGSPYNAWHSPFNTGGAQALAFQAGATLTNMEFTHTSLTPRNYSASGFNAIVGMGGHMVNALGERFVFRHHEKGEQGPRWVMPWAAYWEIKEGRGPCYFDVRHLSPEALTHLTEHLLPVDKNTFNEYCQQRKVDPARELLEIQICEMQHPAMLGSVSGILVDRDCKTTMEGLYAAGGCAAGIGSLSGALCTGRNAGAAAGRVVAGSGSPQAVPDTREARERVYAPLRRRAPRGYEEVEGKLQQVMSDYVGIGRTELGLQTALQELDRVEGYLDEVRAADTHELMRTHEVRELLAVARMTARGALERKESRFGLCHYRGDYPERRPEWHKSVLQRKTGEGVEISYHPSYSWGR